jgi:hypothetical protein
MVQEGNWARVSQRNCGAQPPDLGAFLTTDRPACGMPAFNRLAQANYDLMRYRGAARITTNKANVVSIIRRDDPSETVSGFSVATTVGGKGVNEKFKPAEAPPESSRATSDWPKPPGSAAK